MDELLTVNQVAQKLKKSPKTIRRWIKEGTIAFIKLPKSGYLIKEENLERWIDKHTMRPIKY